VAVILLIVFGLAVIVFTLLTVAVPLIALPQPLPELPKLKLKAMVLPEIVPENGPLRPSELLPHAKLKMEPVSWAPVCCKDSVKLSAEPP